MADRPLGALVAEVAMRILNQLVLAPLRRLVIGEDAWTSYFEDGHDGHPWWWYREGSDGRLVLVGPIGARPAPPVPKRPVPATARPTSTGAGVRAPLSGGRATTPIDDYRPDVHDDLVAELDLLCALVNGDDAAGGPDGARSPSLAARAWGTRTGRTQRRADRYLASLGAAGVIDRRAVGSRAEWHVPEDALQRFQLRHGFAVADVPRSA